MEATPVQSAEGLAIVQVLASVLEKLVVTNNAIAQGDPGQVTKFHAMKAPGINVLQYLERIHKYASCSNECYILALIYIDRLIQRNNFLLTDLNVHRVVITAILLAAKFFDDAYYNNAYYAKIGGVLVSEINGLEVDFLFRINFSLHVSPEEFKKYQAELWTQSSHATPPMVTPVLQSHQIYSNIPTRPQPLAPPPAIMAPPPQTYAVVEGAIHRPQTHTPLPHITPSPPPEARRVDNMACIPPTTYPPPSSMSTEFSEFRPMQRANSVPYQASSSTAARCLPAGSSLEIYVGQFPQAPPAAQRLM